MTDKEQIISWANRGEIISLIKEYRTFSGKGLKESKDIIDSCCLNLDESKSSPVPRQFDIEKLLDVFHLQSKEKMFIAAIEHAMKHYKVLGFDNPFDLVRVVTSNFEGLYQ